MKNKTTNTPEAEPVFIADECGDTLWDAVLQQEVKACEVKTVTPEAASLLVSIQNSAVVANQNK